MQDAYGAASEEGFTWNHEEDASVRRDGDAGLENQINVLR